MKIISLRPVDLESDFGQLAALFSLEQDEPTTEPGLKKDYENHKERIIRLMVAQDEQRELIGFQWATRSRSDPTQAYFYLIVKPEKRRQGTGSRLMDDLEETAKAAGIKRLRIDIRDNRPECLAFAERRGFTQRSHLIGMTLDLNAFDDLPYDEKIARLQAEGFQFTTMEALGNLEEAQRKLYALNDTAASETLGSEGEHPWISFDDFQKNVCHAEWYKPAGQMVVIDTATGRWAAMSAITRFEGVDYAYNLFTGVDKAYRGRKLAQSVKVLALRYARDVLKVDEVHTHHNTQNLPMIAIDRKLGYIQTPGTLLMEKYLE
jgi:RimJ/RimL family protein N-acetyltransferase/L-amino acid N-acyltransferase YncA